MDRREFRQDLREDRPARAFDPQRQERRAFRAERRASRPQQ
jgi:hypothetical protein